MRWPVWVACLALLAGGTVDAEARRLFDASFYAHQTGRYPAGVAVADLDRDGLPDMVTANVGAHTVSVMCGRGDGTFREGVEFPTGGSAATGAWHEVQRLAIGDFDGDGAPDVIVTNGMLDSTFAVLYGNGDGTLGAPVLTPTPSNPSAVAVGDLDGDGRTDLVVSGAHDNLARLPGEPHFTVSVFLGNGDRALRAGAAVPLPVDELGACSRSRAVIADFDGDGATDVALLHHNGHQVLLLAGRGDGTFAPGRVLELGADGAVHLAGADVNRDGCRDLVAAAYRRVPPHGECGEGEPCPTDTSVVVALIGNGGGAFGPAIVSPQEPLADAITQPGTLGVGDLDGDAYPDIALAYDVEFCCGEGNGIVLLRGLGDGSFRPNGRIASLVPARALAMADVDLDGDVDLLSTGHEHQALVWPGNGDGTFGAREVRYEVGGRAAAVATADLDRDGWPDLASANADPAGVSVLLNRRDGSFGARADRAAPERIAEAIASGDFDRDGLPDLAVAGSAVWTLLGAGGGAFGGWTMAAPCGAGALAAGDLDRDGDLDLALAPYGSFAIRVALGRGDGTFEPVAGEGFGDVRRPVSVAIGDFDEDGHPDVACGAAWASVVTVLFGSGDGTLARQLDLPVAWEWQGVAAGDLDRDGHLDLVVSLNGGGPGTSIAIFRGTGAGSFAAAREYPTTNLPWDVGIRDLDADGIPDLAVCGAFAVTVLIGRGDGTFGERVDYGLGKLSGAMAIADVDRDGRPDLAAGEYGGAIRLLTNRGPIPVRSARLDVHPGSCPNRLNPGSKGVTPMALVGGPEFDVREVVIESLRLQGEVRPLRAVLEDAAGVPLSDHACACAAGGPDGRTDLALKFATGEVARALGTTGPGRPATLVLSGTLRDGSRFEARDCVTLVGGGPGREARPWPASAPRDRVQRWTLTLEAPATVEFAIHDLQGRRVARPAASRYPAGEHVIAWSCSALPPGLYFYRYRIDTAEGGGRIVVLR